MPAHEVVRLGISQSPEGRRLFPRMTVVENLPSAKTERPIGFGRLKRKEDARFIRGKGTYLDDIRLPGMLHGAVRFSDRGECTVAGSGRGFVGSGGFSCARRLALERRALGRQFSAGGQGQPQAALYIRNHELHRR